RERHETFRVRLLGASLADGTPMRVSASGATVTILNDEAAAPGDFDGDGATNLGVFRAATAEWFVRLDSGGVLHDPSTGNVPRFGGTQLMDLPLAGDFDGDGIADLGVFRPATAQWLVRLSTGGVL